MDELLSTRELGWVLGRSAGSIRRMIREGSIEAVRIPGAFRVPRAEAVRVAREHLKNEADRTLGDRELERLIDQVIATNSG
jgi:excisionase family DNA binding protein